ncbi:MAG: UDP-N-acetylglucosamine 2-epimerase (non-hydrolyzing) [Candidatus Zixiibacteriota bacterium]|nr:MAG: UDP-N-acetylglucosamine 2-epimerase (non-hydrolyzing) [candidate division Zixibacteria bacterium]
MKILTVVGARPQFIKAAAVSRELRRSHTEVLVHTGQHYDFLMSEVFFKELDVPAPDYNLKVGSASHAIQTAQMMIRLEQVVNKEHPDQMLVYGDTNSTLAGALVGSKLQIPVAHVEAGLRSFNKSMPEEINRILADHVCESLFTPTDAASRNLAREGINQGVYQVGDVMYDALLHNIEIAEEKSSILGRLKLQPRDYVLATIHRAANTDDRLRLEAIMNAIGRSGTSVILLLHPRTRDRLREFGLEGMMRDGGNVRITEPVGYLDMLVLEKNARAILTDSGGVQKEAYMFKVVCITVREETEWVETVEAGWNTLAGNSLDRIPELIDKTLTGPQSHPDFYGDGNAAKRIAQTLELRRDEISK